MKKLVVLLAAICMAAAAVPAIAAPAGTVTVLHALTENVDLSVCPGDQQLQDVLDKNIGTPRQTITFDDVEPVVLNAGQTDDRLKGQGVIFEVISGSAQVGGWGNSGGICNGHLDVSHEWDESRVRVRFIIPGTNAPASVYRVGGFTTTEDQNVNCMEFFDAADNSLGGGCVQNGQYWPETTVEFLGGASDTGIAYVDITSNVPYELDLLSFSFVKPVTIDIKPGGTPNPINLKSKGNVPVAILSDRTFDATKVDQSTVAFAGAPALPIGQSKRDVNGDKLPDLVLHFDTQRLNMQTNTTEACLSGKTTNGQEFKGCDSVTIVK